MAATTPLFMRSPIIPITAKEGELGDAVYVLSFEYPKNTQNIIDHKADEKSHGHRKNVSKVKETERS